MARRRVVCLAAVSLCLLVPFMVGQGCGVPSSVNRPCPSLGRGRLLAPYRAGRAELSGLAGGLGVHAWEWKDGWGLATRDEHPRKRAPNMSLNFRPPIDALPHGRPSCCKGIAATLAQWDSTRYAVSL